MSTKLLNGLLERLEDLIDTREEIVFEERPFLEGGELVVKEHPKRHQNDLEIEATLKAIDRTLEVPEAKPVEALQGILLY